MFGKSSSSKTTKPSTAPKRSTSAASAKEYSEDLDLSSSKETLHLKDPSLWSVQDVAAWLETLDLNDLKKSFWDNAVTGSVLTGLHEDDLKSLNVSKLGDRKRLLKEIQKLSGKVAGSSDSHSRAERDSKAGGGDLAASASDSDKNSDSSNTDRVYFKLHFENDVRALKVEQSITLRKLRREIRGMYDQRMRMKYKDEDGDLVSLRSEKDLSTLMRELQVDSKRTCKLYLSAKNESQAREERDTSHAARLAAFSVFDAFLDPVIVINDSGIIQHANPAVETISGYKPSEMNGKNVNMLMTDEYRKFHDGYLRNYMKTRTAKIIGNGRDVILQRRDGSIAPIHLQVTEKVIGDKTFFFGTMKKAMDAAQSKTMLQVEREVLESLVVPAIITDCKGIIHGFNAAASKLLGYTLVEVINKNISMMMTSPDKEKHDGYLERYMETGKSKIIGVGRKVVAQAKDGSLKTAFLSVTEKHTDKQSLEKHHIKRIYTGILQEV